jgi:omega-amidase
LKDTLEISIVQTDLISKEKKKNLLKIESILSDLKSTDIILLPEMFNTAFCPLEVNLAEKMSGPTIQWMKGISEQKKCSIAGTLMINENNKIYNRLVWLNQNGEVFCYDKVHLFSLAKEDRLLSKGSKKIIINDYGWKICPMICYDIRFPVFCRNQNEYDLLIFLSSWPSKRIKAWDTLLQARAIENQAYTAGVNRVGKDENDFEFPGHSSFFDGMGDILLELRHEKNIVKTVVISKEKLMLQRRQLQFLNDQDNFTIH